MLAAIAALLVCQLIGEAAVRAVDLPFPGPVVGMILLFVLMLARAPLPVGGRPRAPGGRVRAFELAARSEDLRRRNPDRPRLARR